MKSKFLSIILFAMAVAYGSAYAQGVIHVVVHDVTAHTATGYENCVGQFNYDTAPLALNTVVGLACSQTTPDIYNVPAHSNYVQTVNLSVLDGPTITHSDCKWMQASMSYTQGQTAALVNIACNFPKSGSTKN